MPSDASPTGAVLAEDAYAGRMPRHSGDRGVETHGIAPVPQSNRYGSARRLFTVWFAPQVNMTVVFTGLSLGISWASYASDYSRYLPACTSRATVFGYTFAGLAGAYLAVQASPWARWPPTR